ncbi:alpha/beta hydrolase [Microbacterium sp. NPDC089695]|uniref:alpha/beta hydrolase n=1 Tax=Microbacterium sp. NPDC089695 TaxID=3364198 RepID=UPI00381DF364
MDSRHNPFGSARIMAPKDVATYAHSMSGDEPYELGPESRRTDGVPEGRLQSGVFASSRIYPGTSRAYTVYVPQQYSPDAPANLLVFQDGSAYLDESFSAAVVLDNLIASGDLAPTIALFVEPGSPGPGHMWGGTSNRQIEYDAVDDDYARFLAEELMPVALDGLAVTDDPERRAICGFSSGGICSFTAAWHRPDLFRRVISHCGSYINILGGHLYPSTIRLADFRGIRVHLQTGAKDLDIEFGNIPLANREMLAALEYRDYDVRLEFGEGGHTLKHAASVFPETLRWIFRD